MQKKDVTPEIRREVMEATQLCTSPTCTAHDGVVARIWEYKCRGEEIGYAMSEKNAEKT